MYKIIGVDGKIYGPVGADELRQWIAEGRANAQSRLQTEGSTEWRPLGTFSEFNAALTTAVPPPPMSCPEMPGREYARRRNVLAIMGFVCSLLSVPCCFMGMFSVLGIIFSFVGLRQLKRRPAERGKWLAIWGIVISIVMLLIGIAFWVTAAMIPADSLDNMFNDSR